MQETQKPNIDRVGWIAILLLFGGLFLYLNWSGKVAMEEQRRAEALQKEEQELLAQEAETTVSELTEKTNTNPGVRSELEGTDGDSVTAEGKSKEELATLQSGDVEFILSTSGGGVKEVRIMDHAKSVGSDEVIILNQSGLAPIASVSTSPSLPGSENYQLVSNDGSRVVMKTKRVDGLVIEKTFTLPKEEEGVETDGLLDVSIDFKNEGPAPIDLSNSYLYFGSVRQLDPMKFVVPPSVVWNDDGDTDSVKNSYFKKKKIGSTKLQYDKRVEKPIWAGTMNRFFVTMLSPSIPSGTSIWAKQYEKEVSRKPSLREKKLGVIVPESEIASVVHGGMYLPEIPLGPGTRISSPLEYELYSGPKEYSYLKASGSEREKAMFYGMGIFSVFDPVSALLQRITDFFHNTVGHLGFCRAIGSWGVAIILMTIFLRLVLWPFHAKSMRSMKKMSKLAPKMEKLKEKHGDDPQKMQMETMKMYRRYGVNPLGGCLPMLFQFPIFISFYGMLRSAAELRGEKFLWVNDLSQADTVMQVAGFPLNPLPILMGATMFLQFLVGPKTGDKNQRMIFMFMPIIFLVMCYGFAAALALYWTTTNVFTIFQTWIMKFRPEPELVDKGESKGGFQQKLETLQRASQAQQANKKKAPRTGGARKKKK